MDMEEGRKYPGRGPATEEEIHERITGAMVSLSESFGQAVGDGIKIYQEMEQKGIKGPLCFCYVSFLRSSIAEQLPLYRLDFYDEKELLDFVECSVKWDIAELSHYIYEDLPLSGNPVSKEWDWADYEIEQLWITEAERYHEALKAVIHRFVDDAKQLLDLQVQFHFGEYLDQSVMV